MARQNQLQKKASLIGAGVIAAGAHVAQAVGTNAALRTKKTARSLADNAVAGFYGAKLPPSAMAEGAKGIASPEMRILARAAEDAGASARQNLLNAGVDPSDLGKRQLVRIRQATSGKFEKLYDAGWHKTPEGRSILLGAGVPPTLINNLTREGARDLQKVFQDPSNPLTSNILKNITRPSKGLVERAKELAKNPVKSKVSGEASAAGANIALSTVEPITGAINLAKQVVAHPSSANNKYLAKARHALEDSVVKKPTTNQFKQGVEGKAISKAKNLAHTNMVNPIGGLSAKAGNDFGMVVNRNYTAEQRAQILKEVSTGKSRRDELVAKAKELKKARDQA